MKNLLNGAVTSMAAILLAGQAALADEGMWTPDQLPDIASQLREAGLELNPQALSDLTDFPMGAVVSLGGCSGSFVSPLGLVVTNHHCVRGSVQYNSTPQNNYLIDGFLAAGFGDELPAAPGSRIYVTLNVRDVTDQMREGIDDIVSGREITSVLESREKALIAECEAQAGHRCQVAAFHGGLSYRLIDRLEIRDVRLVYAPADAIGRYGGDIDNWMWPRHTGDFSFYRAYVGPGGESAEYSTDNVPYQPEHVLKVSKSGLDAGDFVMAAGYPGSTSRYARRVEVENRFGWRYPLWADFSAGWIRTIEEAAPEGSDARIKYEARLVGLNNSSKNTLGQIAGARRVNLIERRRVREAGLRDWAASRPQSGDYLATIDALDRLSEQMAANERRAFWYGQVRRPQLLGAARRIYRLAEEREKPDAEREPGYQDRDLTFIRQSLEAVERRYDARVDKAEWMFFLETYMRQPGAARVSAFDQALGLPENFDRASVSAILDRFYADTELDDMQTRLALLEASPTQLAASRDPFMRLAAAIHSHDMAMEQADKELEGRMARLRPRYMRAIIDWQADQGFAAYPDANSTLRVTFGKVIGGSPKDGLIYEPFTRLEGIAEKHTGEAPFNSPLEQIELISAGDYGEYALESVASVPVNFLSDLDSTGGNSGSATLNARGELVGLLFDGTFESVNSDWDFDPATTRTIHVDTRYMLWVMEKLDGASSLIGEMTLVD